jgi:RES domain-containing protein
LTPAGALLEWIVHLDLDIGDIPAVIPYVVVNIPGEISMQSIDASQLPRDWRQREAVTQEIGDTWIGKAHTALLYVPSAVVPETNNALINPAMSEAAAIQIERTLNAPFDPRIVTGKTKGQ